ncbi:Brefeldin A resistance protein [Vanrija pseudolonga]|uniref:Brefeldin A resistance protein n=1 Tax=Vanrija pseudolonga TaxID=143232 RepID=A0AAF1BQF1_9TREE|nr:Brefeldin A resistance protein [Vanrija pseudolonga]
MSSPDDRPTTAPPAIDEASSNGQPSTARESISLKRGREGSVDPQASETPTSSHIAAKKNRLETATAGADIVETDEDASAATSSLKPSGGDAGKEGHTVGEVRRKVEELNWEEGKAPRDGADKAEVDVDASEDSKDESKADSKAASDAADSADWVKVSKPDEDGESGGTSESDSPSLKRKAGDEPDASSVASDEKKRKSTSPAPAERSDKTSPSAAASAPSPSAPPKKPQATFGAFSSKSSPFASVSSSSSPFGSAAASSSPFGSAAASSSPFGSAAATSSPFGAAAGSSSPFGSVKPKSAFDSTAPTAAKPGGTSGFGNYSNAFSQFAKKPAATADADKPEASSSSTFGDILREKGAEEKEEKVHLDKQEVFTGEEDEETVFQTRVKLFSMETEQGAWRERGLGALKLNKRRADGGGARLVMRADGVLRVILNASLYVGMTCLEDGKHVRTTVFEGGERRFITIRTANPKVAAELSAAIQEHTPLESARSTSAAARSPSAGAKESV